jgi:HEAT repeat protein
METAEAEGKTRRRSRRIYVYWSAALLLLLVAGATCWALVVPVWKVHRVGKDPRFGKLVAEERIHRLGGEQRAAADFDLYLWTGVGGITERAHAAYLLGFCGEHGVETLLRTLEDKDEDEVWGPVRGAAAVSLGRLKATKAVPALISMLGKDPNWRARRTAAVALGMIEDTSAALPLARALEDENVYVREEAVRALGKLGPRAKAALPALVRALEGDNEVQRIQTREALKLIRARRRRQ